MNYITEEDLFLYNKFCRGVLVDTVINCFAGKPKLFDAHRIPDFIFRDVVILRNFIKEIL